MKSSKGKIDTDFHDNEIPKEGSYYICLSGILINFILKRDKNYYSQMFLEEWSYVIRE